MNALTRRLAIGLLLTSAGCATKTPNGPADPAGFSLVVDVQETNVAPAIRSTVAASPPWNQLQHRTHVGEDAAAWLPGARIANLFQLEPSRVGVVPQQVFAIFVLDRDGWDTLRALPAGVGLVELARAGGYVAVYRTPDANPYAAGTPDAAAWERLRLSADQARRRLVLRVRRSDGTMAEVDTSAADAGARVDTSGSPAP